LDRLEPKEAFLASIDRALDTFGTTVRTVVYFELKRSFGAEREEIPQKPELFVNTIDKIFGVGSEVVARAIRSELEASSGIKGLGKQDLLVAMRTCYHKYLEERS
jgi:hypothetical protein